MAKISNNELNRLDRAQRRSYRFEIWKKLVRIFFIVTAAIILIEILIVMFSVVWKVYTAESILIIENKDTGYRVVNAVVTAYTSSEDETDDTPFITASGARTAHGVLACPPKYSFGTKIVINGVEYECKDRMNPRYWDQERFDIWMETKEVAFNWGIRQVEAMVLDKDL